MWLRMNDETTDEWMDRMGRELEESLRTGGMSDVKKLVKAMEGKQVGDSTRSLSDLIRFAKANKEVDPLSSFEEFKKFAKEKGMFDQDDGDGRKYMEVTEEQARLIAKLTHGNEINEFTTPEIVEYDETYWAGEFARLIALDDEACFYEIREIVADKPRYFEFWSYGQDHEEEENILYKKQERQSWKLMPDETMEELASSFLDDIKNGEVDTYVQEDGEVFTAVNPRMYKRFIKVKHENDGHFHLDEAMEKLLGEPYQDWLKRYVEDKIEDSSR